jgi:hypothetical protein
MSLPDATKGITTKRPLLFIVNYSLVTATADAVQCGEEYVALRLSQPQSALRVPDDIPVCLPGLMHLVPACWHQH